MYRLTGSNVVFRICVSVSCRICIGYSISVVPVHCIVHRLPQIFKDAIPTVGMYGSVERVCFELLFYLFIAPMM